MTTEPARTADLGATPGVIAYVESHTGLALRRRVGAGVYATDYMSGVGSHAEAPRPVSR